MSHSKLALVFAACVLDVLGYGGHKPSPARAPTGVGTGPGKLSLLVRFVHSGYHDDEAAEIPSEIDSLSRGSDR